MGGVQRTLPESIRQYRPRLVCVVVSKRSEHRKMPIHQRHRRAEDSDNPSCTIPEGTSATVPSGLTRRGQSKCGTLERERREAGPVRNIVKTLVRGGLSSGCLPRTEPGASPPGTKSASFSAVLCTSAVRTPGVKGAGAGGSAAGGLASPALPSAVLRTAGGGESPPVPLGVETSMSAWTSAEGDNALYMVAR
eukprot:5723345-Amphidinium_carterae.1